MRCASEACTGLAGAPLKVLRRRPEGQLAVGGADGRSVPAGGVRAGAASSARRDAGDEDRGAIRTASVSRETVTMQVCWQASRCPGQVGRVDDRSCTQDRGPRADRDQGGEFSFGRRGFRGAVSPFSETVAEARARDADVR
jgi:hypothetical protein